MLTTIIPGRFKHVPELSVYNHNVYTDGKMYILEDCDENYETYEYYEVDNNRKEIRRLGVIGSGYEPYSIFSININQQKEIVLNSEIWAT